MSSKRRLAALDALRGLTVLLMVLVNNGVGPAIPQQLQHSAWNGFTLCDLVFPLFLFMVGVSISLSLGSRQPDGPTLLKILRRTILLFLIGTLLHVWDMFISGDTPILPHLRVWGVLQRIAICYCVTALCVLSMRPRRLLDTAVILLAFYALFLLLCNGYAPDITNGAFIVDSNLFGTNHLYRPDIVDPEGLMGTISAIAQTLIGTCVGLALKQRPLPLMRLLLFAVLLIIGSIILTQVGLPLNKRVWSPSYVLLTTGIAIFLIGILIALIDMHRSAPWSMPLQMVGHNALALYVLSELISPVLSATGIKQGAYELFSQYVASPAASVIYSLLFVVFIALMAWFLHERRIFIKL